MLFKKQPTPTNDQWNWNATCLMCETLPTHGTFLISEQWAGSPLLQCTLFADQSHSVYKINDESIIHKEYYVVTYQQQTISTRNSNKFKCILSLSKFHDYHGRLKPKMRRLEIAQVAFRPNALHEAQLLAALKANLLKMKSDAILYTLSLHKSADIECYRCSLR